jgi:hypothetical protein
MINEWKLQTANIVIPVLSAVTNTKPFKNQRITETLMNGIKNVSFINKIRKFISNKKKKFYFRQQMHQMYGL